MTKSKKTKKALLASVLSMMLCVAMLAGTTFAWFTDTAGSDNNRIKSGNLRINLLGKVDKDGKYDPTGEYGELSDDALFDENTKWEPGQVYCRELKVVNEGNLAAKFAVNLDPTKFMANFALEPDVEFDKKGQLVEPVYDDDGNLLVDENGNLVDEEGNLLVDHKGYANTGYSLADAIKLVVYPGSYAELVKTVNDSKEAVEDKLKELKDEVVDEDPETVSAWIESCEKYLAGYKYSENDRRAFEIALELNDVLGTDKDENIVGFFFPRGDDNFLPTDADTDEDVNGFYLEGTLAPKDKKITVTETETNPKDGTETKTTKIIEDHKEFILIAYWPEGVLCDDDYNLNNDRKATKIFEEYPQFTEHANLEFAPEYTALKEDKDGKTELDILDDLRIQFDIVVYATQTPYEKDSFSDDYDVEAKYELPLEPVPSTP